MSGNNSFIFNLDWYAVLLEYPEEVRFEVYEAIMRYALSGTLAELKPLAKMAFSFIKKEMDYNREKYESTVEKRRAAVKSRWERQKAEQPSSDDSNPADDSSDTNVQDEYTSIQSIQMNNLNTHNDNDNDNNNDIIIIKKHDFCVSEIPDVEKPEKPEQAQTTEQTDLETQFEEFRRMYPGTKRGFKIEFENFRRKNPKTWRTIIPLLIPAITKQIQWHERSIATGQFTPNYKHLQTWINQQCWTEEQPEITAQPQDVAPVHKTAAAADYDVDDEIFQSKNR